MIQVDYIGDLKVEEMKAATVDALKLANELKTAGKQVLVLVNSSELQLPHSKEREYGSELLKTFPYDKVAVYGENKLANYVINLLVTVSQTNDKVRIFTTREEAEAWLKEQPKSS